MNSGSGVPHPYLILWGSGVALSCSLEGEVLAEELHGLFAGDTRVLSTYQLLVSGQSWRSTRWTCRNTRLRSSTVSKA